MIANLTAILIPDTTKEKSDLTAILFPDTIKEENYFIICPFYLKEFTEAMIKSGNKSVTKNGVRVLLMLFEKLSIYTPFANIDNETTINFLIHLFLFDKDFDNMKNSLALLAHPFRNNYEMIKREEFLAKLVFLMKYFKIFNIEFTI